MLKFPEKLKHIRKSQKLTQKKLQQLAGTGINTISNFENGYRSPCVKSLEKLSKALKVEITYFLDD